MTFQLEIIARTECGKSRSYNLDTVVVARFGKPPDRVDFAYYPPFNPVDQPTLLMVFDSVFELLPEVALKPILRSLELLTGSKKVPEELENLSQAIHAELVPLGSHGDYGASVTTLFCTDDQMHFLQIGDTRGYLFREGRLHKITTDQTAVEMLVQQGMITPEETRTHHLSGVLLQAIGVLPGIKPMVTAIDLRRDDTVLLCSDGLWKLVEDSEIAAALGTSSNLQDMHANLFELLEKKSHHDNASVILARVTGENLPPPIEGELRFEIVRDVKPYPFPYYPPLDILPKPE